jgi:hypothetical protein
VRRPFAAPHDVFTTRLMSTGLTFGSIGSLSGLNAHIIDHKLPPARLRT